MDLKGQVDVPVVGPVDKRVLLGVGGVGAAFLGWRWYQARNSAAYDPDAEPVDPGMEDAGILPSVSGAVSPDNSYGLPDSSSNGADSYGFTGKTNAQWTQYAANQLAQASDTWSYATIISALGAFIANKPLTTARQEIVQAAIGLAGYPPEGSHVIIPGGDTTITVAPTGLKVTSTTTTTAELSWQAVAGATGYRIYRSGVSQVAGVANGTTGEVGGLTPNASHSFQVAAFTASGQIGPKSNTATGRTKAVTLKAPTGVRVTSIAATAATVSWGKVPGATSYRVYVNGTERAAPDGTVSSNRLTGLSKRTRYSVQVAADTPNQPTGPKSSASVFTTKTK